MNESLQRGNLISFKTCGKTMGLHVFILEMKNILDLPKQSHILLNYLERKITDAMGGKKWSWRKILQNWRKILFLNQRSSQTTEEKENPQLNKALRNPRQRTKSRKILKVAMKRKRLLYLKKLKNKIQMWCKVDLVQLPHLLSIQNKYLLHPHNVGHQSSFWFVQEEYFYVYTKSLFLSYD